MYIKYFGFADFLMAQRRYEENQELMKLVSDCTDRSLSNQEMLRKLKEKGFPISEKTLQRIKQRIVKIRKAKIVTIASAGRDAYVVESIEILTRLRDDMLKEAEKTDNFWIKHNADSLAAKFQNDLAKFYDAGSDIGSFWNGK